MAKQYKNYVNGEWKTSENEITIYAPANGEELGSVPAMSQAEVDEVYAAAKAALPAWRALSYAERAVKLFVLLKSSTMQLKKVCVWKVKYLKVVHLTLVARKKSLLFVANQ